MSGRDRMVERQIYKVKAAGHLTDPKGEGNPVPDTPSVAGAGDTAAITMGIIAEAGVLPEEIRLTKKADAPRQALAGATDLPQRKTLMAPLADLKMRLGIAQEARQRFLR